MRYPIKTLIPTLAFLLLAACGGGNNPPGSTPSPTPAPGPTPVPTPSSLPPAAITFTSATPSIIGRQLSGKATTSQVVFTVTDKNGDPVANNIRVDFTIGSDATPSNAVANTSGGTGEVSITVNSGSLAGPIPVTATVNGYTTPDGKSITTQTAHVSVGGGVPVESGFTISPVTHNISGLVVDGITDQIEVRLSDQFKNYDILEGTAVNFYPSAGAIISSGPTDKTGVATGLLSTQNPRPASNTYTEDTALTARIDARYGTALSGSGINPKNGWVYILATAAGQESYTDTNGNGFYDPGTDSFNTNAGGDDIGEPFMDLNGDGVWNTGEFFPDLNNNGVYDQPNGVWDGPNCTENGCINKKYIFGATTVVFTGSGQYCKFGAEALPVPTTIPNPGSQKYWFMVGDQNLNALAPGTHITITATAGSLSGITDYTVPDQLSTEPTEISFTLTNNNTTGSPVVAELKATVTGPSSQVLGCPGNFPVSLNVTLQ